MIPLALLASAAFAQPTHRIEAPRVTREQQLAPVVVQLDAVPLGTLVTMLLRDIWRVPYAIAPDVLADRRPISVRLIMPQQQVGGRVAAFLRRNGLAVTVAEGTAYVGRAGRTFNAGGGGPVGRELQNPEVISSRFIASARSMLPAEVPAGNPLDPGLAAAPRPDPRPDPRAQKNPAGSAAPISDGGTIRPGGLAPPSPDAGTGFILGYIPAHRSPSYLAEVIGAVLPGLKFGARSDTQPNSDQSAILATSGPDVLVMSGSPDELDRARKLVELLDRARPMVAVKAVVIQAAETVARGSALSVLAKVAGGNIELGSFGAQAPGSQFVRIGAGAVSAVLSAVNEDNRFRVVATPNLAALSGAVATMNSGAQVPTVGAVSIAEGGTPVQSVEYRDSGITLTVKPTVRGELIEMEVREERSTFVRTTTGVLDTPTLQKSSASASVILKSGESVVLVGLTEVSEEKRREGILGGLLGLRSRDKSESELLVVLTAEVVASPEVAAGLFVAIGPDVDEGKGGKPEPPASVAPPVASPSAGA